MRAQDNFNPFPEGSGRIDTIREIRWSEVNVPDLTQRFALESGLGGVATFSLNPTGSPAAPYIWRSPREIAAFIDGKEVFIPFDTMFRPHPKGGVTIEAISTESELPVSVRMKMGQAGLCLGRFLNKEATNTTDDSLNVAPLDPVVVS